MKPSVIAITLSMLAACGGLAYLHATRNQPAADGKATLNEPQPEAATAESTTPVAATSSAAASADASPPSALSTAEITTASSSAEAATPETIDQLIKDTESPDAKKRAAAIARLADVPKAQALPALKRVIETGEPEVDRHIALRSMYSIALKDGDPNGQVRDLMRQAIYHGDNDGVTQTAQSLLDDIEAEFASREPAPN